MSPAALTLIAITDSTALAGDAEHLGIDRVMIDLESRGKAERQSGLALRLSGHTLASLEAVAKTVPDGRLMVRLDAWWQESPRQVESVLEFAPTTLMLPMVRTPDEVAEFARAVAGRARLSLLIETVAGVEAIDDLLDAGPIDEIHIGLNDLRIDGGYRFLFEPLADGTLKPVLDAAQTRSIPCGIGGIARLDEGLVPGRLVLAELIRLNAAAVILSRTFTRGLDSSDAGWNEEAALVVATEIAALRQAEDELRGESSASSAPRHDEFTHAVANAVEGLGQ